MNCKRITKDLMLFYQNKKINFLTNLIVHKFLKEMEVEKKKKKLLLWGKQEQENHIF